MRKRGLQDVKRRNRQVILEKILEHRGVSRVEIAQETGLAPSTVSALVGELLSEGILVETGTVITAGRSRTSLALNPECGGIAVIEIGRTQSYLTWFDLSLNPLRRAGLTINCSLENELLTLIIQKLNQWQAELSPVVGIGLLFQEDMRESDLRVMYSTGFSSASITLREALITQYHVPVEEEYSVTYTVTTALTKEVDTQARNSLHISLGSRILATLTLDGRDVPLRNTFCEELCVTLEENKASEETKPLWRYLADLVYLMCMMFSLETVFLSGDRVPDEVTTRSLQMLSEERLTSERCPTFRLLRPVSPKDKDVVMAQQVLKKVLLSR